jgi:hypothetical protein
MSVDLVKDEPAASPPAPLPAWVEPAVAGVGLLVAVGLAFVTALFEAFLSPLQSHGWRIPVSLVAAVVLNPAIVWFSWVVTRRKAAALLPAVVWMAVMFMAGNLTTERDLVITEPTQNWVGVTTMVAGSVAFAIAGYRLILAGLPPVRRDPEPSA